PGLASVDRPGIVSEALARVAAESSTWLRADLSRHIATLLPAGAAASASDAVDLVEELTALAAGRCVELLPEAPAGVARRRDGRPVSEAVTDRHLTTAAVLDQESRLLGWAGGAARPGPLPDGDDAQAAAEAVAGDERLVLVVGPAGTGKTTALGTAALALAAQGRPVVGIAPSGKAADVLGAETGWPATTVAKLLSDAARPGFRRPPAGTTVVLDEAGMAATDDLAALVGLVDRHGWRLVCVGDPAQLPAVGRGGMFELWCERVGAHTLEEVRRFDEAWQAEASVALRRGERSAAAAYADHGRLDAVRPALLPERVARVHDAMSRAGRSLSITTASAGMARDINLAIQRGHDPGRAGPSVALADGSTAFTGDRVATRRNDRIRTDAGQTVRNRHIWDVESVGADGSLVVSHPVRGRARLPAAYVSRHVELGWAVTGYGTQGDTTDDGICVLEPSSTRSGVYVGMTRGRGQNLGLVVDPTGMADPEEAFAAVIARPANARSALAVRDRLAGDRAVSLPATGPPAPAMTNSGHGARPRTAGPVEPCPAGPDAAGASAPAAQPMPGAPPAGPADAPDDDDLVARMRRRLGQVERQRPPDRARRR
ncbi:MAG: ATP-dependent DNA helicase, partial [Acidimicrobiales bacterium]